MKDSDGMWAMHKTYAWSELTPKEHERMKNSCCPYDGHDLMAGPSGGASQNVACSACWQEFCVSPIGFQRLGVMVKQRAHSIYGQHDMPVKVWFKDRRSWLERVSAFVAKVTT